MEGGVKPENALHDCTSLKSNSKTAAYTKPTELMLKLKCTLICVLNLKIEMLAYFCLFFTTLKKKKKKFRHSVRFG